jgi:predicted RNA-binding Zn-ribbon protein involved in translation (DUF1610 family)
VKTLKKCPRCEVNILKGGAKDSLSRKDNKTMICSDCGTAEAIEEMMKFFKED